MSDTTAETSTPTTNAGEPKTTETGAGPATTAASGGDTTQASSTTAEVVYDFKLPEGVNLDTAAADEFKAIAKEAGLKPEHAQKVADVAVKMQQRQAEAHAAQVESWIESVKSDKEIGGDKLEANLVIAKKAIDQFGSPALVQLLNDSGLGNHPEVIKMALKVGKQISQDGFVPGAPKGAETDPAKRLFPNMN